MRFLSLELKGYKRLSLNNIDYIRITLTEKIQLILGTNGSGKSSLLRELSPLPAVPQDFRKEGYKVLELEYQNKHYQLISRFSTTNRHQFLMDGTELNPGGTGQVQKELVYQHFGITPEIHEVMIGTVTFHAMPVSQRRHWFTQLSQTNYSYALKVYQALKEKQRDIQGAIKLHHSRLVKETERLMSPEDILSLQTETKQIQKYLDYLLDLKSPVQLTTDQLKSQIRSNMTQLEQLIRQYQGLQGQLLPICDEELLRLKAQLVFHEHQYRQNAEQLDQRQQIHDQLIEANIDQLSDLDQRIIVHQQQIDHLSSQLQVLPVIEDIATFQLAFQTVYMGLVELLEALPVNPQHEYQRSDFEQTTREQAVLTQQVEKDTALLQQYQLFIKEQEHYRDHHQIECPQCHYVWSRGYDPERYQQISLLVTPLSEMLSRARERLVELDNRLASINHYSSLYKAYRGYTELWRVLRPLWDHFESDDQLYACPQQLLRTLQVIQNDIELLVELNQHRQDLDRLIAIKQTAISDNQLSLEQIKSELEDYQTQCTQINQAIALTQDTLHQYERSREIYQQLSAIADQLKTLLKANDVGLSTIRDNYYRDALNRVIQIVRLELVEKEQQLTTSTQQQRLVDELTQQIADLTQEQTVLQIMVQELSPTTGLIAKGLMGFINCFVEQMNAFIRQIWLYPLELIPVMPNEEETDLDFKFQVNINDNTVIPDITKCSSAMKEIIDLAFKIVSMYYLGLSEAPLYLDELSHTMDQAHRRSTFKAISELLTHSQFSTLFIVSHFQDCYGSLKNTEVLVLNADNIGLPNDTVFNRHVIFG